MRTIEPRQEISAKKIQPGAGLKVGPHLRFEGRRVRTNSRKSFASLEALSHLSSYFHAAGLLSFRGAAVNMGTIL